MSWLGRRKRGFDRWVYRRLHGLYKAAFPSTAGPAPLEPANVRRLLVARTDRVGDMIVFSPALEQLRRALPHAEIDVMASPASATLLAGDARVSSVYVYRPGVASWLRAVRTLRARRYDAVLTVRLRDHLYEGIFAALVAGRTGARISARRPTQYVGLFTHLVRVPHSRRHILDRLVYLAHAAVRSGAALPPDARRGAVPLVVDAEAERRTDALAASFGGAPFVAFNAWGSDPRRCFGAERAAEIAAMLAERHPELVVVLTPAPDAVEEAAEIVRGAAARLGAAANTPAGRARVVAAPVSRNLHDLVSLLRRAAVVVTPDTANMHIAAAVRTPLLAVYTAVTDADVWGAWGEPRHVLHVPAALPIRDVPAADVARAFDAFHDELLAAGRLPAPAAAPPR